MIFFCRNIICEVDGKGKITWIKNAKLFFLCHDHNKICEVDGTNKIIDDNMFLYLY